MSEICVKVVALCARHCTRREAEAYCVAVKEGFSGVKLCCCAVFVGVISLGQQMPCHNLTGERLNHMSMYVSLYHIYCLYVLTAEF